MKIEDLLMSLRSVEFLIGLFEIVPPKADLKYSITPKGGTRIH